LQDYALFLRSAKKLRIIIKNSYFIVIYQKLFRAIERVKGVHHTTVITWVKQVGMSSHIFQAGVIPQNLQNVAILGFDPIVDLIHGC
jgi:hypothetical protein